MPISRANVPNDLISFALGLQEEFPGMEVWYRGQSNAEWVLQTSLDRSPSLRDAEEELLNAFYAKSLPMLDAPLDRLDYTQRLALARHYGLPSRLLDWSESVTTAAFHAVGLADDETLRSSDRTMQSSALIYALIPRHLNCSWNQVARDSAGSPYSLKKIKDDGVPTRLVHEISEPIPLMHHWHEVVGRLVSDAFESRPRRDERILGVMAPISNPRMASQQAAFTIHGTATPLDRLTRTALIKPGPEYLHQLEIPFGLFDELRAFLEAVGVRESRVFPDLDHLAIEIERLQRRNQTTGS